MYLLSVMGKNVYICHLITFYDTKKVEGAGVLIISLALARPEEGRGPASAAMPG